MKGVDLRSDIPIFKQAFSRGNQGDNLTDENSSFADRTNTPNLVLSLLVAILSLLLFILFLSERL